MKWNVTLELSENLFPLAILWLESEKLAKIALFRFITFWAHFQHKDHLRRALEFVFRLIFMLLTHYHPWFSHSNNFKNP